MHWGNPLYDISIVRYMHWSNPLYDICIAEAVRRLDSDIVGESADEETAMKAVLEFVGASGIIYSLSRIIGSGLFCLRR